MMNRSNYAQERAEAQRAREVQQTSKEHDLAPWTDEQTPLNDATQRCCQEG
jgi:hypothetical protein